jgi:head-tail adaptor
VADQFDKMMNKTCSIQARDANAPKDGYNQPSAALVSKEDTVPCRISVLPGKKEYKSDRNYALGSAKVFMRPRAFAVTEHMVLVIDSRSYDILDVQNPSGMNHHLELIVQEIRA